MTLNYAVALDGEGRITATIEGKTVTEEELVELQLAIQEVYQERNRREEAARREEQRRQWAAAQRVEVMAGVKVRVQKHIDHGGDIQAWLDEYGEDDAAAPFKIQVDFRDSYRKRCDWIIEGALIDPKNKHNRKQICGLLSGKLLRFKSIEAAVKRALELMKSGAL